MNWFIKLSQILDPTKHNMHWLNIGHDSWNNFRTKNNLDKDNKYKPTEAHDELWLIDKNWEFFKKITNTGETHEMLFDTDNDYIAHGRYDAKKNVVSLGFRYKKYRHPTIKIKVLNKVESILRKQYGTDVNIYFFDDSF